MHELSVATAVVESAERAALAHGADTVESVRLRIGALAGVVADALRFSFGLAAEGTALAGARLDIEEVPARARCAGCLTDFAVGSPPDLGCPGCGRAATELCSGRELELAAVVLPPSDAPCPAAVPAGPGPARDQDPVGGPAAVAGGPPGPWRPA